MNAAVMATLHNAEADRCVKVVKRSDGAFGLQEFRKDPEDAGGWTLVGEGSRGTFASQDQAIAAARLGFAWLRDRPGAAPGSGQQMAMRVVTSLHNDDVDRCVDIIRHADGTFGFKEFRRDPEDRGGWTLVSYNPRAVFATREQATAAARAAVVWLRD